jgi:hypothetical protein
MISSSWNRPAASARCGIVRSPTLPCRKNPGMRALFERSAKMHAALAEKLNQARKAHAPR